MTKTAEITARMAAAQRGINSSVAALAAIGRKARSQHDKARDRPDGDVRDAAINGLIATSGYCDGMVEEATGRKPQPRHGHDTRDNGGKFTKNGSYGHLQRMVAGK